MPGQCGGLARAAAPLLFVPSGSDAAHDVGGCSVTRAAARCACTSPRIGLPASTSPARAIAAKQVRGPLAHDAGVDGDATGCASGDLQGRSPDERSHPLLWREAFRVRRGLGEEFSGGPPRSSGFAAAPVEPVENKVESPFEFGGVVVAGLRMPRYDLGEVGVVVEGTNRVGLFCAASAALSGVSDPNVCSCSAKP